MVRLNRTGVNIVLKIIENQIKPVLNVYFEDLYLIL